MSPCNYADYDPEWKSIRRQILDQADHRCEGCGVDNYAVGARDKHGIWHDEPDIHAMNSGHGEELFGEWPDMVRIVLTIAHLCHDTTCRDPTHLRAWCQKCHNAYDAPYRRVNAAATVARKKQEAFAATGQQTFLGVAS